MPGAPNARGPQCQGPPSDAAPCALAAHAASSSGSQWHAAGADPGSPAASEGLYAPAAAPPPTRLAPRAPLAARAPAAAATGLEAPQLPHSSSGGSGGGSNPGPVGGEGAAYPAAAEASSRRSSAAEAQHVQQRRGSGDAPALPGSSLDLSEDDIAVVIEEEEELALGAGAGGGEEEEEEEEEEEAPLGQQPGRGSLRQLGSRELHDADLSASDRSGHLDGISSHMWSVGKPDWIEGVGETSQ